MKTIVNLTLDKSLTEWLDSEKGTLSRSKFVNGLLQGEYEKYKQSFDWGKEGLLADEDIAKGNTENFKNADEAIKWLKS